MLSGFFQAVGSTLRTLQNGFFPEKPVSIDTRNVEAAAFAGVNATTATTTETIPSINSKYTYSFEPEVNLGCSIILPNSSGDYELDSEDEICKHEGSNELCDANGCYFTKSVDDLMSIDLNKCVDCSLCDASGNCQCGAANDVSKDCLNRAPIDLSKDDAFENCDNLYSIEKNCFLNKIWYSKELTVDEIKKHLDIE